MTKLMQSLALAAVIALAVTGCSKSNEDTASTAGASPAATMVYSGSTDTSTGGTATTAPAAATGPVKPGDIADGKAVFTQNCSSCHGATGNEGGVGPKLTNEKSRKNLAATVAWIKNPTPPMPKLYPSPLDDKQVVDVATYVQSL